MITDAERSLLVSSIGWVDGDSLWTFHPGLDREDRVSLGSGARYLSLHSSGTGHFAVAHHFDGARFEVTVHSFERPAEVLARAVVEEKGTDISGDPRLWKSVPRLYTEYLKFHPWREFVLLKLSIPRMRIDIHRLDWYDDSYDKMYQAIVGVTELPGRDLALVSVQRCSDLVIHDLGTGRKTGVVRLAGRGGNPTVRLRKNADEIWAIDYDTVVVLDPATLRTVRSRRLQKSFTGTMQFLGEFHFEPEERSCTVARPFSGDVVGIDPRNLEIKRRAKLGRQPLEAAALPDGRVVARDWKTGETLRGASKKLFFGWLA